MTALPEDVSVDIKVAIDELESAITEVESRLESTRAERDEATARQAELEQENARLRHELGLAREQQSASADVLSTIANSSGDAEQALRQIAETTMRLFGAPSTAIHIAEGDGWSQIIRVGDSSERVGAGVPESQLKIGGRNMPGTIVGENRQVHVPDLDNVDPDIADWPGLPHVRAGGTKSMSGSPLRREGKAIGALIVYRDRLAPFTGEEMLLQQSFADQAAIAIENARLINETRESLERQTATADILKVIASSPSDVQPVFEAIAVSAKHLLGGFSATVLHFIGDELHLVAFTPTNPEADEGLKASFPRRVAEFPIFQLVRDGATIQFPDTEAENVPAMNRDLGRLRGFRSVLFVPLMNRGQPVGILSVTRIEPGAFAGHHVQLLQTFADQAVIAIENTRLFNETQEALERQTATADILKVIASSPSDVQPVFEAIVGRAVHLCGARMGRVYRYDGDLIHMVGGHGLSEPGRDSAQRPFPRHASDDTIVGQVMLSRRPNILADLNDADTVPPLSRQMIEAIGARSQVTMPMLLRGQPIGAITLSWAEPRGYSDQQIALLQTFADQAVIAIENTRLFNETQEALERQTATADILKVIASSPSDTTPVFEAIANSANRLLGAFSTVVFRLVDGTVHLAAFTPTNPAADEALVASFPMPVDDFEVFRLARDGQAISIPDTEEMTYARVRELARLRGFRSILYVPLMNSGVPIGIIAATRAETGTFAPHHIQLLQTFADQAVIAIENTRLFNETREALERQTATADILKVIASSPSDVQPVFDAIAHSANRLIGGFSTAVYRFVDDMVHMVAFTPTTPEADAALQSIFPLPRSEIPALALVDNGETAQIADSEAADPQSMRIARARGWRSVIFTPLMNKDVPIGFISVTRRETGRFADHHVQLLRTFADQAVIAIENTRLFNETREALERQTATADILKVIASSPSDVQPVFEAIAHSANRLVGGFSTAVHRFIDDIDYLAAFTPTNPESDAALKAAFPRHISKVPAVALARNGESAQIADSETADASIRELGRARGWRSVTYAPLINQGTFIGFIACTRREPGVLADHHVQLLRTFADQAVIAIENTRLFNETQEALERQTATAEILKVIASSPSDVQPVFDAIAASANRLIGGFSSAVTRYDGQAVHLAAFTSTDKAGDEALKASFPRPLHDAHQFQALRNGGVLQIPDTEVDTEIWMRETARKRGWRSQLLVPLMNDGAAIGMISVTRVEPGAFAPHHVQLLQTFADQAVIAIENTRLFNETKEALERQTATAEILKVIASSPSDVQPVFDAIAHSANRLIGGFSAAVFRYSDGKIHLAAFTPTDAEGDAVLQSSFPAPLTEFPPYQLTREGAPAELPDTELEPAARDIARARGYRSMLFAPLMNDGEPVGIITVTRIAPGSFGEQHVRLLQMFADQAVIAIKNVGLFNEVQKRTRDLSEALTYQTGSANILSVIASSPTNVQPVLKAIVESACELCEADDALVTLKDGDDLTTEAHHGSIPTVWQRLPMTRDFAAGRAVIDRTSVHVRDLLAPEAGDFPGSRELARRSNVRTVLAVPLLREGDSVGAIVLRRTELNPFSEKQINLLQTFADQAVIAIGNVRLFEEVQAKTRDLSEALTYQTGSANILKVIASSPTDIKPVLHAIVESACELCGAYDAVLRLKKGDKLELGAHHGTVPADWNLSQINPYWTAGRAALEQSPVHVHDMSSSEGDEFPEAQARALEQGHRTILSVPMLQEANSIGTITLRRLEVNPFSDKQIALLQTFADQAVIAIGNVRLFEEVQQRTRELSESLEQQTATSEVLGVISRSAGDLQPVFQSMLENATRICSAQFGIMNLREGDEFRTVAFHNVPPEFLSARKDRFRVRPDGILAQIVRTRQVAHTLDLSASPLYAEGDPPTRHLVDLAGARTLVVVPMLKDSELVGTIGIYRCEVLPFNEKQIALLSNFASQAVIAIENTRLLNELRQRTGDLTASLENLRTAQDRLVQTEKLASLGQLTAGIAHEIKNPLNFVNNFAALSAELTDELNEVLRPAEIADKIRSNVDELTRLLKDNLEKIVQHGKRADSIVKNMLLHSREGGGDHRPADINALIDESLNLAYHGARAEKPDFNVTLQRDFDPSAGMLDMFPQEISRVFLNLVSNGFYAVTKRRKEHGEAGFEPTLRATTKNLGDTVEIRVRDNGTGIPPEVKEKMFNPFFTTKPAGEGTGLGLSMSHDIIVKQHGGTIDVDSEPGHFTEFRIVLPRSSNFSDKSRG